GLAVKTYRGTWFIVPPRFPAISSPVTVESCRKALAGALEESPAVPAGIGLSRTGNPAYPDLACRRRVDSGGRQPGNDQAAQPPWRSRRGDPAGGGTVL